MNNTLSTLREQFLAFWGRQSRVQQGALLGLVVGGLAAIVAFVSWANTPTYAVAFSGLSEADAGQIVQRLQEQNVAYQLKDGSTILVQTNQVYEVRLSMAREGLPQSSNAGYELFSGTTLGMTEFTQRVNYQRALEGELERTIGSLSAIDSVRVHIVTPEKALLASDQQPTTASITLDLKGSQQLDPTQIRAITHLVAASVEGLKSENVVIVDVDGHLLATGDPQAAELMGAEQSEKRRQAEAAQAQLIETRVHNLLETVLGPNKSVVKASVQLDWRQRNIVTQAVQPDPDAIRSVQTLTETYDANGLPVGGIPGVLSNVPPITSTTTVSDTASGYYLRQENTTNFEMTQVESQEVIAPGEVERITLSVMVDGISDTAKLLSLTNVISTAAGINAARGDTLAVEAYEFDRTFTDARAAEAQSEQWLDLALQIGAVVGAAAVLIGLLIFVQRQLNRLRLASAEAWMPILQTAGALAAGAGVAGLPARSPAALAQALVHSGPLIEETISVEDRKIEEVLVGMAEENPQMVSEIIRIWLNEDKP
jgi:flagellar M-ring protein FliF